MIDIETLGTRPNAPVLSIGAVQFDPDTGDTNTEFYTAIDPADAFRYGAPDGDTFKWWMQQSDGARAAAVAGKKTLVEALTWLEELYPSWDNVQVWANGPSFDLTILEYAYQRCLNRNAPWKFWNARCCRTIAALVGRRPPVIAGAGVHHNALDDARHQAEWVSEMWQELRNKPAPQPVSKDALDLLGD